jgi:hypothetical protein
MDGIGVAAGMERCRRVAVESGCHRCSFDLSWKNNPKFLLYYLLMG